MKNEKSLIKSIFLFSISSWVNIVLGLVYTILSTRLLSPEIYGSVSVFMSSSNTLMYIICLGLDASLIRFFNERPNNESKQKFQTKMLFLVTINMLVIFFMATVLFFDQFNMFMFGRLSWFLTIMLFFSAYAHLLLRFLNISYRMSFDSKKYTIQNILIQSSTKVLTLVAALFNPTYEVVVLFQVTGIAIITVTYFIIQKNEIVENIFKDNVRNIYVGYSQVIKFALFSAPLYISTNINILLLQNIIRTTLGAVMLGIYSSVAIFGTLFSAISTGFSTFWSAYVYKNYDEDQKKIQEMSDYIVIVGLALICCFVLFKDILYLFIGKEYQEGIRFFSMMLSANVIDLLSQASYYGIDIVKKNYITAITNCVYLVINAVGAYCGAVRWGIIGAAFCIMLAKVLLFTINTVIAQHYYKSIAHPIKFFFGLFMILSVAVLPALDLKNLGVYVIVLLIILVEVLVFFKQFNNIYYAILDKFKKAGVDRKI